MKQLSVPLLFLITLFIFISCQKQLEFDSDGNSIGTIKANAGGDCLPSHVNGIYKADTTLIADNYIDVQINIANPGAYNIYTDSVNGYSFKKAGTIGATGLQTIRLYGTGKPTVSGLDIFTITYGTSTCKININVVGTGIGVAAFTLSGAPDTCTNFIVTGNYFAGQAVTPAEFLTLTVNVTSTGTYNLSSSNNDGLSFSGSGSFSNTGLQNVTLNAIGTPVSTGVKYLNILYAVGCPFNVFVTSASAVFTFGNSAGNCTGAVVAGIYKSNIGLTSANTVTLNVNVTQIGGYSIGTNNVNGIYFTGSGSFNTTGANTIILYGHGTPVTAGDSTFAIGCNFVISFGSGPVTPPMQEEYLPMTTNTSFRLEVVGGNAGDTTNVKVLANDITLSANSYRIFQTTEGTGDLDSFYYRKNNGKYFMYHDDSYGLDNPINKDGQILDSSLAVNAVWNVDLGNNAYNGIPGSLKYEGKILEKNASATIASVAYTKIIKVQLTFKVVITGFPAQDILKQTIWFAKGKGVIYQKVDTVPPGTAEEIITKNIYVAP